jgi:hypothetical protein
MKNDILHFEEKYYIFANCEFTSNPCTWRSMTTSMQIELMRWVVLYSVPS